MAVAHPEFENEFMETIDLGTANNAFNDFTFLNPQGPSGGTVGTVNFANASFDFHSLGYYVKGSTKTNMAYWPFSKQYSRCMGLLPKLISTQYAARGVTADSMSDLSGPAYRALFRLERHPDWYVTNVSGAGVVSRTPNNDSAFVGVYILTVAMYKDLEPAKSIRDATGKRIEQLTDPAVVYLRDKKVR